MSYQNDLYISYQKDLSIIPSFYLLCQKGLSFCLPKMSFLPVKPKGPICHTKRTFLSHQKDLSGIPKGPFSAIPKGHFYLSYQKNLSLSYQKDFDIPTGLSLSYKNNLSLCHTKRTIICPTKKGLYIFPIKGHVQPIPRTSDSHWSVNYRLYTLNTLLTT